MKFYPYKKGVVRKSFSHAEGGHKGFGGSFYAVAWSFSNTEGGGRGTTGFEPANFPF